MSSEDVKATLMQINAQLQVIDSTISALIESHPDQDYLRDRMQTAYSLLLSGLETQLIAIGQPGDSYTGLLKEHMDMNLALLQPPAAER